LSVKIIQPPELMAGAPTAGKPLFKKQMKSKLRFKFFPKLAVLLLSFWFLVARVRIALATPYGSGTYSESSYGGVANSSFFNKYGLIIIFALIILTSLLWLIILLARRRKRSADEDHRPPTPLSEAQP